LKHLVANEGIGPAQALPVPKRSIGQALLLTTEHRQELRQSDGNRQIVGSTAMDCIEFRTRGKYADVAALHVLPPLRYAARAIQYCSEYNFFPMQRPPHSNSRAEPSHADSGVPNTKMPDGSSQLSRLKLDDLESGAPSGLLQIFWAVDGHDFH
jgi:hypothetical protein